MFDRYFEAFLADNFEGKRINYGIRYQVYCLETGYEDSSHYPDRMEYDAFDKDAVHFIAKPKEKTEWIAALRLVIRPFSELPMNQFAKVNFDLVADDVKRDITSGQIACAEVSRLCVVSQYRRRVHERTVPFQVSYNPYQEPPPTNNTDPAERRKAPWLMLGLINAARDYSEKHNIRYWFFMVADSLARITEGLGFTLQIVGPECEHRGIRRPYFRDLNTGYENLAERLPIVHQMFTRPSGYRLYSELREDQYRIPLVSSVVR
jgi:N-acyl amino acid synthase of PEP-CTERM/exosortase system